MPEIEIPLNEEQMAMLQRFTEIRRLTADDTVISLVVPVVVERVEPETLIGIMVHRCR